LVAFLENDCDINLADEDITEENFQTMRRLEELIASKLQAEETGERP
jgi:acyl carrier protein